MKKIITIWGAVTILIITKNVSAQTNTFPSTGAAGIGTIAPNASSLLEIKSTSKGLLIPRMTKTQRDAIVSPASGLLIYQNNSTPGFYYYSGSAWQAVSGSSSPSPWIVNGTKIYYNSGNVGIGTSVPAYTLDVKGDINISTGSYLRINGIRVLRDNPNSGDNNVFLGDYADTTSSPGFRSTAVGSYALSKNTAGYNTAVGSTSLQNNTTGASNTAVGEKAMLNNTTGGSNVALGSGALYTNAISGNNVAVGFQSLYKNTASENVAIGYQSLYSNSSASDNIALGYRALFRNTSGSGNLAIGSQSLYSNTTAINNTAVGYNSMYSNTSGTANTSLGWATLDDNTTGFNNTALGNAAMELNVSGAYNTAIGSTALQNNTGSSNTAVGEKAMQGNSNGGSNSALGSGALQNNVSGNYNTSIGFQNLYNNATNGNSAVGYQALFNTNSGNYNSAIGYQAGFSNTTGGLNIFIGEQSGYANTTGSFNSYGGYHAGYANTTGNFNTYYGYGSGLANSTGNQNTFIGYEAGYVATGDDNTFVGYQSNANSSDPSISNSGSFGLGAICTAADQIFLGNSTVSEIVSVAKFITLSDGRYKKNIKENVPGLDFINKLRPVTYTLDVHSLNKKFGLTEDKILTKASDNREKEIQTGFIAQEVEKAARSLNYDFSGVKKPQNDQSLYGLSYSDFVVPLVKAVQQLSSQSDSLKQTNITLQSQINELKAEVQILADKNGVSLSSANDPFSSASLEQNVPNPYNQSTIIHYTLPQTFNSAQIIITDYSGKVLKQIPVSMPGKGSININAGTLLSGAYNYTLAVDGKLIDTKKMILAK